MEDLEGEAIQELSLSEETSNRLQAPASLRLKELRDRVKLRYLIHCESNMFLELVNGPVELFASISFEQLL
jgi:hypothetical protein